MGDRATLELLQFALECLHEGGDVGANHKFFLKIFLSALSGASGREDMTGEKAVAYAFECLRVTIDLLDPFEAQPEDPHP